MTYTSSGVELELAHQERRISSVIAASTSSRIGVAPGGRRAAPTRSPRAGRRPLPLRARSRRPRHAERRDDRRSPSRGTPVQVRGDDLLEGTNRSPSGSSTKRGSSGGTFTRANRRSPSSGRARAPRGSATGSRCTGTDAPDRRTERRQHREDPLTEQRRRGAARDPVVELDPVHEPDALLLERRQRGPSSTMHPYADRARDTCRGSPRAAPAGSCPSGDGRADAGLHLLLETRDAHLEELVEVRTEDREELHSLEQRRSERLRRARARAR